MNTSEQHLTPAWTRDNKKNKASPSPRIYSNHNNSTTSSLDLASASSSTAPPQQEAPYLTHLVRHHGHLTLVPPDNTARTRQPGTADDFPHDGATDKPKKQKKKKLKKKVGTPDPAVLDAVINAGRSPSSPPPPPPPPHTVVAGSSREGSSSRTASAPLGMSRSRSQGSLLDVPSGAEAGSSSRASSRASCRAATHTQAVASSPSLSSIEPPVAYPFPQQAQDSHASLLLSSSALLDSPPPAYPPRSESSSPQPQPAPPPPPLVLPTPAILEPFVYSDSDPFVVAWEADRAAGLPLDERIARDIARRNHPGGVAGQAADEAASVSQPLIDFEAEDVAPEPPKEEVEEQRREIAQAEAASDAPRVARALSMYAGRRFAEAAERRIRRERRERERLSRVVVVEEEQPGGAVREDAPVPSEQSEVSIVKEEELPTPSQEVTTADVEASHDGGDEEEMEEEESESDEDESRPAQLARAITINANRRFAEAAERRLALERAARMEGRNVAEAEAEPATAPPLVEDTTPEHPLDSAGIVEEEEEEEEEPYRSVTYDLLFPPRPFGAGSSSSASTSPATSPHHAAAPLPSPPPLPPLPPKSPPRVPQSAFADLAPPSLPSPPPAPTLDELNASSPVASTSSIFRRPPPLPPLRPSSLVANRPPPPLPPAPPRERPSSLRRPAPPPPPPSSAATFSATAIARRPLPVPPSTEQQVAARVDAFTLMRERERQRARDEAEARLEGRFVEGEGDGSTRDDVLFVGEHDPASVEEEQPLPPTPPAAPPQAPVDPFAAYTDLDLLLARLDDEGLDQAEGAREGGRTYDDFNTLSEVLGPAIHPGASQSELESLDVALVELERRRVDKQGRVKMKLSVVGVRCTDCSVCLSRFKVGDRAVVLPKCLHAFHETCITSWLARSRVCPLCRDEVFPERAVGPMETLL